MRRVALTLTVVLGAPSVTPAFPEIVQELCVSSGRVGLFITVFTLPDVFVGSTRAVLSVRFGRAQGSGRLWSPPFCSSASQGRPDPGLGAAGAACFSKAWGGFRLRLERLERQHRELPRDRWYQIG